MADAQMKFQLDVANFDSKSRAEKSLINFIMQNGAMYLRSERDENDNVLHVSGNVRTATYAFSYEETNDYAIANKYDVFIVYTNSDYNTYPKFNPANLPDQGDSISPLLMKNYIADCNTVLCQTSASLAIYSISYTNDSGIVISTATLGDNIADVTITPKIGNTTNDDENVLPDAFVKVNPDDVCAATVDTSVEGSTFRYDTQLRTVSFTVKYNHDEDQDVYENEAELYYKIGIFPVGDGTIDDIKETLLTQGFDVQECAVSDYGRMGFRLGDDEYKYFIQRSDSGDYVSVMKSLVTQDVSGLPNAMLLPLQTMRSGSAVLDGFMYCKLCNTNGTPFNGNISGPCTRDWLLCYKSAADDTPTSIDNVVFGSSIIPFTTENINGGFVQWDLQGL